MQGVIFPLHISTDYTENKHYRTIGIIDTSADFEVVGEVLTDFESYRKWAVRGLDGREPGSEDLIGLLTDTMYTDELDELTIMYDVRLPWPLGSEGNRAEFTVTDLSRNPTSVSFDLVMKKTSALLKDASLQVNIYPEAEGCRIEATALVRFTFLLNLFFDLPGYKKTIEWRIVRVMTNMEDYIREYTVCRAPGGEG